MILLNLFLLYLVGNKCDLDHVISKENIEELKKENNIYGYIDTSAKDDIGINQLFDEIGEMLIKIHGIRKKGHNVKLADHAKKQQKACGLCPSDL